MNTRSQYVDAWGKHQPSAQAREVLWAASYAENPPAPSTGRHHRLRALALFQQMLAQDFGGPLATLVAAEQNIAAQQERIALAAAARTKRVKHERDIERYLVKRVKELGGEVRKVAWPGRRFAPDRVVFLPFGEAYRALCDAIGGLREDPGRHVDEAQLLRKLIGLSLVWPEMKAPGEKPTSGQLREHERMRALGQRVVVIDSIEGVDEVLK